MLESIDGKAQQQWQKKHHGQRGIVQKKRLLAACQSMQLVRHGLYRWETDFVRRFLKRLKIRGEVQVLRSPPSSSASSSATPAVSNLIVASTQCADMTGQQCNYRNCSQKAEGLGHTRLARAHGFSLVEVSMVTALMILIAIVGIPAIQGYVIENRVPRVAEDLQRFVARLKVSGIGAGPAPYLHVGKTTLVNGLRDAAAIQILTKDQSVVHGLGGAGRATQGTISLLPAAAPGGAQGSAFKLVLTDVNHAACPALAAVMQRLAVQVKVGGQGPAVEVKNGAVKPPQDYDPILADAQCGSGDVNTFEFVVQ